MSAAAAARLPPLAAPLLLAALLACTLQCAAGIPYIQDELLWTKQRWQEYKLPFPWSAALKERDAECTRQLRGPLRRLPLNSMNGPLLDAGLLQQLVAEDARRPAAGVSPPGSLEVTLLDESASQEAAAGVAQCKVCGSLIKQLWGGLTHWVNTKHQVPNKAHIAAYAQQLCEYEVPNEVLKNWVLLRARARPAQGLPGAAESGEAQGEGQAQGHEFYLLSQRAKQHATPAEIDAVRKACRFLLREDGVGKERERLLLHLTSTMLHQYYRRLAQGLDMPVNGRWGELVEAVDDGPTAQRTCVNRHPQCELWREKGECEGNTVYMVGDPGADNGWCRPACGVCSPPEEPHELGEEAAKKLADAASTSLLVLQSQACLSNAPCQWAAGAGMKQLLAKAKEGAGEASEEAVRVMDAASYISGPVLSRQQQLQLALDKDRLKETKTMLQRPLNDALVKEDQLGEVTLKVDSDGTEAAQALSKLLAEQCLYLNTGWWMYQLCYKRHITQFHMTEKLQVEWVISLGKFEGANWTIGSTHESGLYPATTQVPYVSHTFGDGNHCDLDPDPQTGEKRGILRRTQLRLMCSPDADRHIAVTEPQQCVYQVELYLPVLCQLAGFTAQLPDGMSASLDAAWNGQYSSGTADATPDALLAAHLGGGGGTEGGAAGRGGGTAVPTADDDDNDDDDPYEEVSGDKRADGADEEAEDPYEDEDTREEL